MCVSEEKTTSLSQFVSFLVAQPFAQRRLGMNARH